MKALIVKGWPTTEEQICFPEREAVASSKTDHPHWIVDGKDLHFGNIALLNGMIVGVLPCYTQSRNRSIDLVAYSLLSYAYPSDVVPSSFRLAGAR